MNLDDLSKLPIFPDPNKELREEMQRRCGPSWIDWTPGRHEQQFARIFGSDAIAFRSVDDDDFAQLAAVDLESEQKVLNDAREHGGTGIICVNSVSAEPRAIAGGKFWIVVSSFYVWGNPDQAANGWGLLLYRIAPRIERQSVKAFLDDVSQSITRHCGNPPSLLTAKNLFP